MQFTKTQLPTIGSSLEHGRLSEGRNMTLCAIFRVGSLLLGIIACLRISGSLPIVPFNSAMLALVLRSMMSVSLGCIARMLALGTAGPFSWWLGAISICSFVFICTVRLPRRRAPRLARVAKDAEELDAFSLFMTEWADSLDRVYRSNKCYGPTSVCRGGSGRQISSYRSSASISSDVHSSRPNCSLRLSHPILR
jgi:hypothetical protein